MSMETDIDYVEVEKRLKIMATDARFAARDAESESEEKAQRARREALEDALDVVEEHSNV